mmetsp:Transcript_36705/g.66535  ORF Transcript_36705/g.66535 Transcript_36705/m.66535 type:complete len:220 (+) Transcript_36705:254-913(+)
MAKECARKALDVVSNRLTITLLLRLEGGSKIRVSLPTFGSGPLCDMARRLLPPVFDAGGNGFSKATLFFRSLPRSPASPETVASACGLDPEAVDERPFKAGMLPGRPEFVPIFRAKVSALGLCSTCALVIASGCRDCMAGETQVVSSSVVQYSAGNASGGEESFCWSSSRRIRFTFASSSLFSLALILIKAMVPTIFAFFKRAFFLAALLFGSIVLATA